jgi:hypothetical protein
VVAVLTEYTGTDLRSTQPGGAAICRRLSDASFGETALDVTSLEIPCANQIAFAPPADSERLKPLNPRSAELTIRPCQPGQAETVGGSKIEQFLGLRANADASPIRHHGATGQGYDSAPFLFTTRARGSMI